MSDTQVAAPETTNGQKPHNVEYGLEVVGEELPDRPGKSSPIQEAIEKIRGNPPVVDGKPVWVCIGKYGNASAATAAANVLRQREGHDETVGGFSFATRRVDNGARTGLFVKYNPDAVTPGGDERQAKWMEARKAKAATKIAKRAATVAKKAAASK